MMDAHVARLLSDTLSPDADARKQAEQSLSEAHRCGDAGLSLARICLAQDVDISLRQSAGINLRRYVQDHWSIALETFKGDPPDEDTRAKLRQMVFGGLSDPSKKIRLACAYVVSEIASSDWPDEWPDLLNSLVALLASGSADSIHGSMRVMVDFVSADLSEDQLLPLAGNILPHLLAILGGGGSEHAHAFDTQTRAQAVSVFRQCLSTLYMVKETAPQAAQYASKQVLPQWIAAFKSILANTAQRDPQWRELPIYNEIYEALSIVLVSFPKTLSADMAILLHVAIEQLTLLAPAFRTGYLNDDLEAIVDIDADSREAVTIPRFAASVLEFVASCSRRTSGKPALVDQAGAPSDLLLQSTYLAIFYAQIPTEDEDRWTSDVNAFVADEDEEIPAATLRTAALDLVGGFFTSFRRASTGALQVACQRAANEAASLQSQGQDDWWKSYEACLAHLSSAAEEIAGGDAGTSSFDLSWAFDQLVGPFMEREDLPFLQGRTLIFASTVARHLPPNIQEQFFNSALQAFESPRASTLVKVAALRALKNFCQQIPDSPTFAQLGSRITANLLPFVTQATEATLVLILETLQRTLALGTIYTDAALCDSMATALLYPTTSGEAKDPLLASSLAVLYNTFAGSSAPAVQSSLLRISLPRLAEVLKMEENDDSRPVLIAVISAIDSILDGMRAPLAPGTFTAVAESLFTILRRTEDDSILQEGLECLTFVIRKNVRQLTQWSDPCSGENGLSALLSIVARTLDPARSEAGSLFVGDLLLHLCRCAGQDILPVLPDLLRALVERLSTATTSTFSQSLILPFAYLIHTHRDTVLELLEGVQVQGKSGVVVLLSAWSELVDTFQGFWNIRISTVALCQLLAASQPSIQDLVVKGDLIVTEQNSEVIMTRSRAKKNPDRFTQIPFKAKALKVLLREYERSNEKAAQAKHESGEELDDDDDQAGDGDDWEDDEEAIKEATDITDFLGSSAADFFADADEASEEDDEDLRNDPVYSMDIQQYIRDVLRSFATSDRATFDACVQYLTAAELHTLHSL